MPGSSVFHSTWHRQLEDVIFALQYLQYVFCQGLKSQKGMLWFFQADLFIILHLWIESCQTKAKYHPHKAYVLGTIREKLSSPSFSHTSYLNWVVSCSSGIQPFLSGNLDYIPSHLFIYWLILYFACNSSYSNLQTRHCLIILQSNHSLRITHKNLYRKSSVNILITFKKKCIREINGQFLRFNTHKTDRSRLS